MEDEKAQLKLVMPLAMRKHIKKAAIDNGRTLNGEIVYQLKKIYGIANEKTASATN